MVAKVPGWLSKRVLVGTWMLWHGREQEGPMGLDGVEIIMRTEETFGIEIPDNVAQQILTPAALVDFVAAKVPMKPTEECLSQQLFYRLRRGFRSQLKALSSTFDLDKP